MAESEEPAPRIVDKRVRGGEGTTREEVHPLSPDERAALEETLARQGQAADEEEANTPAIQVGSFVIVTIDPNGAMRMYNQQSDLEVIMARGITADHEATAVDITNMANQWHMAVLGNEVTGRVMQALAMQAQAAMAQRNGAGGLTVPQGMPPRQ